MRGYIKESRDVEQYGWRDHPAIIVRNFILHKASIAPCVVCGMPIKRGQLLTSYEAIMAETGLSRQQVRSAIKRCVDQHVINSSDAFKAARALTPPATCRGILITVINYDCEGEEEGESNTSANTSSNIKSTRGPHVAQHHYKKEKRKEGILLVPPSVEDVLRFCKKKGFQGFDAQGYVDKYNAVGWKDRNGQPIIDWRAHVGYCAGYKQPQERKTVSAQQYTQRKYAPGELDAIGEDLLAEARRLREDSDG